MGHPAWMWLTFIFVVIALLGFDLGVMNRKEHEIEMKEGLLSSAFYIFIGLLFGGWILYQLGPDRAEEYYTGFIIEKSLSIDNVFVMAMLFSFFHVPRLYQHRVLFWGILGAIVLRALLIGLGAALIERFEWVLDVFAVFLIFTGIKMMLAKDTGKEEFKGNALLAFMQKHLWVTDTLHGHSFFVRQPARKNKRVVLWVTPLFLALVMIEFADVIFALDSVPAIFMITKDPLVVFTSNIFAILGLRSLYFVLSAMVARFHYLKYALSVLLVFIGGKTFVADLFGLEKFPTSLSLIITFGILGSGILFSLFKTRQAEHSKNA